MTARRHESYEAWVGRQWAGDPAIASGPDGVSAAETRAWGGRSLSRDFN